MQADKDLMTKVVRGDIAAFDTIVQRYGDVLYRHLVRLAGPEHAETLCEQTFLQLHASLKRRDLHRPLLEDILRIATRLLHESSPVVEQHIEVLSLCADAGLSIQQAAETLSIPPETAQARLAEALQVQPSSFSLQPLEEALHGRSLEKAAEELRSEGTAPGRIGFRVHMLIEHPVAKPKKLHLVKRFRSRKRFTLRLSRRRIAVLAVILLVAAIITGRTLVLRTRGVPGWINESLRNQVMVVVWVRSPATVGGHELEPGDRLPAGTVIQTGRRGSVGLVTRGGAELTLNSDSRIMLGDSAERVTLIRGEVYCASHGGDLARMDCIGGHVEFRNSAADIVTNGVNHIVTALQGSIRVSGSHRHTRIQRGERILFGQDAISGMQLEQVVDPPLRPDWCAAEGKADYGDRIIYTVRHRDSFAKQKDTTPTTEAAGLSTVDIWAMNLEGRQKRRLFTLLGDANLTAGHVQSSSAGRTGWLLVVVASPAQLPLPPRTIQQGMTMQNGVLQAPKQSLLTQIGINSAVEPSYPLEIGTRTWMVGGAHCEWLRVKTPKREEAVGWLSPSGSYATIHEMPSQSILPPQVVLDPYLHPNQGFRLPHVPRFLDVRTGRVYDGAAVTHTTATGAWPRDGWVSVETQRNTSVIHVVDPVTQGKWIIDALNTADFRAPMTRTTQNDQSGSVQLGQVSLSPDGRKLAYGITEMRMVPIPGAKPQAFAPGEKPRVLMQPIYNTTLWVLDSSPGSKPACIHTEQNAHVQALRWAPDGSRIAVSVNPISSGQISPGMRLPQPWIALIASNGSSVKKLPFSTFSTMEWSPKCDALFLPDGSSVSGTPGASFSPGSGVVKIPVDDPEQGISLGGNQTDSPRSVEEQAAIEAAMVDVAAGLRLHNRGEVLAQDLHVEKSREAFETAARVFQGIIWKHPRAGLLLSDLLDYANAATERAKDPCTKIILNRCAQNLSSIRMAFIRYVADKDRLPNTLSDIEENEKTHSTMLPHKEPDGYRCRTVDGEEHLYIFIPPEGGRYRTGDTVFRCPAHPNLQVVWDQALFSSADTTRHYRIRAKLRRFGPVPQSWDESNGMRGPMGMPAR